MTSLAISGIGASKIFVFEVESRANLGSGLVCAGLKHRNTISNDTSPMIVPTITHRMRIRPITFVSKHDLRTRGDHGRIFLASNSVSNLARASTRRRASPRRTFKASAFSRPDFIRASKAVICSCCAEKLSKPSS